jgi:hypothetical protein
LNHHLLPLPYINDEEWEKQLINRFKYCINVYRGSLTETDYDVWVIAFKDKDGNEIARLDADKSEIKRIQASTEGGHFYNIWREFNCNETPHKWILWPHSKSKDWCELIEQEIPR